MGSPGAAAPLRLIQVGVGGYGRTWLDTLGQRRGRAIHVALVDTDPAALAAARLQTGLAADRCFATLSEALDT